MNNESVFVLNNRSTIATHIEGFSEQDEIQLLEGLDRSFVVHQHQKKTKSDRPIESHIDFNRQTSTLIRKFTSTSVRTRRTETTEVHR